MYGRSTTVNLFVRTLRQPGVGCSHEADAFCVVATENDRSNTRTIMYCVLMARWLWFFSLHLLSYRKEQSRWRTIQWQTDIAAAAAAAESKSNACSCHCHFRLCIVKCTYGANCRETTRIGTINNNIDNKFRAQCHWYSAFPLCTIVPITRKRVLLLVVELNHQLE